MGNIHLVLPKLNVDFGNPRPPKCGNLLGPLFKKSSGSGTHLHCLSSRDVQGRRITSPTSARATLLLCVLDYHITGKANGAMRQNFLINGGDGFSKACQMLVIDPLTGWQANGHGVYLPVIDNYLIMKMRAGGPSS